MKDKRAEKQKEALEAIKASHYHGIILMSVRSGKTKIGIDSIKKLKPNKILWITPETKLRDEAIPAEFVKFKAKGYLGKTDIVCYSSLHKITGCYDYVIMDEYQHITEKNVVNLLTGDLKYNSILAMSGTHPKEYLKRRLCDDLGLQIIYQLTTDAAAADEIVADYQINIIPFYLDDTKKYILNKKSGKYLTEKRRYEQLTYVIDSLKYSGGDPSFLIISRMHLLYNALGRVRLVSNLLSTACNKKRGLIFHPNKKKAELYPNYFHSSSGSKHFEAFQQQQINQLHLVNKGGVGYTYRDLDFCIISQTNSDRTGLNTQKWGRTLLPRPGHKAQVYMLCCKDTVDEKWVASSIENVDASKIKLYENFI